MWLKLKMFSIFERFVKKWFAQDKGRMSISKFQRLFQFVQIKLKEIIFLKGNVSIEFFVNEVICRRLINGPVSNRYIPN